MRVRADLRRLRRAAGASLSDAADLTGVPKGELSNFERGHCIPRDAQAAAMAAVYGDPAGWYPAGVRAALAPDLRLCLGCGEELEPHHHRRRLYHEGCRPRGGSIGSAAQNEGGAAQHGDPPGSSS